MANILTHPTNGAIYFDDGTPGSSSIPALTGNAVSLNHDGSAGLNIVSKNTTSTDRFTIDGDSGRLFSVNDSLTGTIFSVNDASGLPIVEVESTSSEDTVTIGTYNTNALVVKGNLVGIGTASPSSKLDIVGDGADFFLQSADYKIARIQPRGTSGADLDKGLFSLFDGSTEDVRIDTAGSSWFNGGSVSFGSDVAVSGNLTAPTAGSSENSTKVATTAFVKTEITNLIGGAPGALNTLNELAAAINDDSSFASTVTTSLAGKAGLSSSNSFTNSYNEFGNNTGAVSNDGSWHARVNISGTSHARLDLFEDADNSKLRMYVHTGQGARIDTTSNTALNFGTYGTIRMTIPAGSGLVTTTGQGTLWGSSNDGSGSGLDADLLDGQHGSHYLNASNISSGTLSDDRLSAGVFRRRSTTVVTGTDWDTLTDQGTYGVASPSGAQFTGTGRPTVTVGGVTFEPDYRYGHLVVTEDNGQGIQQTYYPHAGSQKVFTRTGWSNGSWGNWTMNWNTNNMGSGSNLDADKLDGLHASSFNQVIGTDSDIDTSGATVIDQLNMTDGVIQSHSTRTLTLSDLGYTGATNANNYSLPAGSSSTRGGFKIGYSESGKNYPVEVSSEKMYVNVPWTDTNTNTTYSAGSGLGLSGTTFSHSDTSSQSSVNYSNGTVIQDVTLDTYGHVTGLSATDLDGRYYTESEIQTFLNQSYIHSEVASNLAVGWYTIAINGGNRAIGRFGIRDTNSSDHQSVVFYAGHNYGTDASNTITVLHATHYSGNPFRYIRIKDHSTYDGAALQVYIDDSSNSVAAYILGDNFQSSGWTRKDWIPDATDPGGVSNYSSFTEASRIDLNQIAQGGIATTGPIYADGDTTQYKVLTTNDEGSGNGLDADTLDAQEGSYYRNASNLNAGTIAAARLSTATTQASSENSTKIATTAFVKTQITNLIGGAPGALDTLNELAAAINDDASYASTITTALAGKLSTTGKAADSDKLDGVNSSSFARSDAADTFTQRMRFDNCNTNNHDTIATSTGSQGGLEVYNNGSGNDAFMAFHSGGDYAIYFGLDADSNKLSVGGWSMGANKYEIYHSGNKPSLATLGYTGATNANYITNNNQLTNGAGYTTNTGDITNVGVGTGLDGGGSSGSVTIYLDLTELTDMTQTFTASDEFIVLDGGSSGSQKRKPAGEIGNSVFINDSNYVTSSGNTVIGTDSDIDTSGATVIDQLNMTDGVITSHSTRTLTLANLGYTGATNANNYSLPAASSSTRGGVKIGYSENGKNYPVEVSSEKMYVNVPWTDTNTTYSVGDGGLTQKNFTTTLKSKLDGIASGATANTGDITNVNVGVGLDGGGSSGSVTINLSLDEITLGLGLDATATGLSLDLSELTDMTSSVNTSQDELILLDNGAERRKRFSEIFGSNAYNSTTIPTNNNQLTNGANYVARASSGEGVAIGASYTSTTPPTNGMIIQGNVGIGTSSVSGYYALQVNGNIQGSYKSFVIDHPTKENTQLAHACLEGPEIGVYFRGKSTSDTIVVADYWDSLVDIDTMTVDLTAIGPGQDLFVSSIKENGDVVVGTNTDEPLNYYYVVYGERKDINKLDVEFEIEVNDDEEESIAESPVSVGWPDSE